MTEHRRDTARATLSALRPTLPELFAVLTTLAEWFLPVMMRLFATGMLVFGSFAVVMCAGGIDFGWLNTFGRWNHSHGMDGAGAMLGIVYVVWSAFVWKAAGDPHGNRLFVNFTIAGNCGHAGLMMIMALYMPGDFHHMYMDILFFLSGLVPLTVMWWLADRAELRRDRPAEATPAA